MTSSNKDQNNSKINQLINGFYGIPYLKKISHTPFEKKLLQQYIYEECDIDFDKDINFESELVDILIDFGRYYHYNS